MRVLKYLLICHSFWAFVCAAQSTQAEEDSQVTVLAAASLVDVTNALDQAYQQLGNGGIVAVFGSSAALARQIENGAPADVFLSANASWMDYLVTQGHIARQSQAAIAGNILVLIVPTTSALRVDLNDGPLLGQALRDSSLVLGDPASVPAGIYAKQALESLNIYDALSASLIYASDVRFALAWVARDEVDAGIVYATDAAISPRVRIAGAFPAASHEPIIYWAGVTRTAGPHASEFIDFLLSNRAQDIFQQHGFQPVSQHSLLDAPQSSP